MGRGGGGGGGGGERNSPDQKFPTEECDRQREDDVAAEKPPNVASEHDLARGEEVVPASPLLVPSLPS